MFFETLKEKCEYYRSLSDTRLMPNAPVLIMLDGHCFSKVVKNNFKLPFDSLFIDLMNRTAEYICSKIQGAMFAYVQSDEISIFVKDYASLKSDAFFGYRTCKLLSIIAAEATAFFNKEFMKMLIIHRSNDAASFEKETILQMIDSIPELTFDCKAWNVPNENEVFAWFLYRQNDCIRNSKQQFAQTYLPHKSLAGFVTDAQISLTKEFTGKDWNNCNNGEKYGRLIYRETTHYTKQLDDKTIEFDRNEFKSHYACNLNEDPDKLRKLIIDGNSYVNPSTCSSQGPK